MPKDRRKKNRQGGRGADISRLSAEAFDAQRAAQIARAKADAAEVRRIARIAKLFAHGTTPAAKRLEAAGGVGDARLKDAALVEAREAARFNKLFADACGEAAERASLSVDAIPSEGTGGKQVETVVAAPPKPTLASKLGVHSWGEIEMQVVADGIRVRKEGMGSDFTKCSWASLGLKGRRKQYALLIEIAKGNGTCAIQLGEKNRRSLVFDLNASFCGSFGIEEKPFFNARRIGTQARFAAITWEGKDYR